MEKILQLEVTVPERQVLSNTVDSVQVPAKDGYIGVLPGHAALITELGSGVLSFSINGTEKCLALNGGLMEVLPNSVRILADSVEWAEEVDSERAKNAHRRATEMLKHPETEIDVERAMRAISRSEARIEAAHRAKKS